MIFLFAACKTASPGRHKNPEHAVTVDTIAPSPRNFPEVSITTEDSTESEYATFFIVVADTGLDYYALRKKMFALNNRFGITVDTMGRTYNVSKNLIALPDNDEDEMYAGQYFPRRFPSGNLSLEYLDVYKANSPEKTIALVAGIYETVRLADSALAILRPASPKAFRLTSEMYLGCMH